MIAAALHIFAYKESEADGWISWFQSESGEAGMGTQLDNLCDCKGGVPYLDYIQTHRWCPQVW